MGEGQVSVSALSPGRSAPLIMPHPHFFSDFKELRHWGPILPTVISHPLSFFRCFAYCSSQVPPNQGL